MCVVHSIKVPMRSADFYRFIIHGGSQEYEQYILYIVVRIRICWDRFQALFLAILKIIVESGWLWKAFEAEAFLLVKNSKQGTGG